MIHLFQKTERIGFNEDKKQMLKHTSACGVRLEEPKSTQTLQVDCPDCQKTEMFLTRKNAGF